MGQGLSCGGESHENGFFGAVQDGDVRVVEAMIREDPTLLEQSTVHDKLSALHFAAASGQIEVLSMILSQSLKPDILNRHKQTPLMLAAMHGKVSCVEKLIQSGANILIFDSLYGRTCLHYAAYYGHSDCLQAILSAARSAPVSNTWGFARFVNIRDASGATPLHLAALQSRPECVHVLLDSGSLVCASTGGYGRYPWSTPLHLAARGGSLDCIRELLAWGADRLQRDASGKIPYVVALKRRHGACAALLNPSAAEPLVWPKPLKFISELNPEAKALLERALMEANRKRENTVLKETDDSPSTLPSDVAVYDDASEATEDELCCICFEQRCTIEVRECGHQMCAQCTLSLCCHNKPNLTTTASHLAAPACPFCRTTITQLAVVKVNGKECKMDAEPDNGPSKPRKSKSSSFKGLSAMSSFKMGGRNSGRIAAESKDGVDKILDPIGI